VDYEIKPLLENILRKLKKKDLESYNAIKRKIIQIVNSDPEHYKNLKYGLKNFKRVHVRNSFVLVFEHDKQNNILRFMDYDHHDRIYFKYR
jgi:YafQ family addiction module toxin component